MPTGAPSDRATGWTEQSLGEQLQKAWEAGLIKRPAPPAPQSGAPEWAWLRP